MFRDLHKPDQANISLTANSAPHIRQDITRRSTPDGAFEDPLGISGFLALTSVIQVPGAHETSASEAEIPGFEDVSTYTRLAPSGAAVGSASSNPVLRPVDMQEVAPDGEQQERKAPQRPEICDPVSKGKAEAHEYRAQDGQAEGETAVEP